MDPQRAKVILSITVTTRSPPPHPHAHGALEKGGYAVRAHQILHAAAEHLRSSTPSRRVAVTTPGGPHTADPAVFLCMSITFYLAANGGGERKHRRISDHSNLPVTAMPTNLGGASVLIFGRESMAQGLKQS